MRKDLSSKKDFEVSSERQKQERQRIIRNLSSEGKKKFARLKNEKAKAIMKARSDQFKRYAEDLAKERKHLIEKKPKLELLPPGRIKEKKRKAIERQAIRNVTDAHSKELAKLRKSYNQKLDRFLAGEAIKMKESFKDKAYGHEGRERLR